MLGSTASLRKLMVDSGAEHTGASHVTFAPDVNPTPTHHPRPTSDDTMQPPRLADAATLARAAYMKEQLELKYKGGTVNRMGPFRHSGGLLSVPAQVNLNTAPEPMKVPAAEADRTRTSRSVLPVVEGVPQPPPSLPDITPTTTAAAAAPVATASSTTPSLTVASTMTASNPFAPPSTAPTNLSATLSPSAATSQPDSAVVSDDDESRRVSHDSPSASQQWRLLQQFVNQGKTGDTAIDDTAALRKFSQITRYQRPSSIGKSSKRDSQPRDATVYTMPPRGSSHTSIDEFAREVDRRLPPIYERIFATAQENSHLIDVATSLRQETEDHVAKLDKRINDGLTAANVLSRECDDLSSQFIDTLDAIDSKCKDLAQHLEKVEELNNRIHGEINDMRAVTEDTAARADECVEKLRTLQGNINAIKLGGRASTETIFLLVAWAFSGATILTQKIMSTFAKPLVKTAPASQPKLSRHQPRRPTPTSQSSALSDTFKQEFSNVFLHSDRRR